MKRFRSFFVYNPCPQGRRPATVGSVQLRGGAALTTNCLAALWQGNRQPVSLAVDNWKIIRIFTERYEQNINTFF